MHLGLLMNQFAELADTDGASELVAVLKSANLPPSTTTVSPLMYSITRLDNLPVVSGSGGNGMDEKRGLLFRPLLGLAVHAYLGLAVHAYLVVQAAQPASL